jgi:hypothetical protein
MLTILQTKYLQWSQEAGMAGFPTLGSGASFGSLHLCTAFPSPFNQDSDVSGFTEVTFPGYVAPDLSVAVPVGPVLSASGQNYLWYFTCKFKCTGTPGPSTLPIIGYYLDDQAGGWSFAELFRGPITIAETDDAIDFTFALPQSINTPVV